jgi:imidazole glycerol phosphate synthase subunit HisF
MGLTQRNIPCLDLKDGMTIRQVTVGDLRDVGNFIEHVLIRNEHEVVTFNGSQPINMDPHYLGTGCAFSRSAGEMLPIPITPDRVETGLDLENIAAISNSVDMTMIVSDSVETLNRFYVSMMDLWSAKQMLVL